MPDWTLLLRPRLARLDLRAEREADIIEELSQHLDERYEELLRLGHPPAQAAQAAMDELIDPDTLVQDLQPLRQSRAPDRRPPERPGGPLLAQLWADLRYALRSLRLQPTFAAIAILTLALGIGTNSAIFALADATLLRPLPLPEPQRLAMLFETTQAAPRTGVSPLNLQDWARSSTSFAGMAGYVPGVGGMVMTGADGTAQTVPRQWVTAGIFDVLGIDAIVGRTFRAEDDTGKRNAVVLSESFWTSRYNADPGIVGTDVRLDGEMYSILGVVPDQAQLIGRASLWGLMAIQDAPPRARSARFLRAVGRLHPDATMQSAAAELDSIARELAREHPDSNGGRGVQVDRFQEAMIGSDLRQTALLFLGVVGFVLLICCANVANLLLVRGNERVRDLAIRSALGANRWRVARQIMTESLVLSVLGCAIGLALGAAMLRIAPAILPDDLLPASVRLVFDLRLVGFGIAAALAVGLLFGLPPAWQATRIAPAQAIGAGTRGSTGRGGRLRSLLVVVEVATAVVLLFGAGLLLRTLLAMESADRGYRPDHQLTVLVDPLSDSYPTPEALLQFFAEIEREVASIHDVDAIAWSSILPLGGEDEQAAFEVLAAEPVPASERPVSDYQVVSPSYFASLDVAMRLGRAFDDADRADGVPVAIVNETFVRTHLKGIDPLGARIVLRGDGGDDQDGPAPVREIVGVVGDIRTRATDAAAAAQIYVPLAQDPRDDIYLLVRSASGGAEVLAKPVLAALARVDTEQLVSVRNLSTLDGVAREATSRHRLRAVLVVAFATLALLLAMVGVFGILAYSVQQSTRDFGVRMALGASTGDVMRLVLRRACALIATGTLVGLLLAVLLSRWLVTVLYGVDPLDPLTFAGVAMVLAIGAAASTLGPAWRAARLRPVEALRGG